MLFAYTVEVKSGLQLGLPDGRYFTGLDGILLLI